MDAPAYELSPAHVFKNFVKHPSHLARVTMELIPTGGATLAPNGASITALVTGKKKKCLTSK